MKILVMGGTGLIGGHIALRLASKGHEVTAGGRNAPAKGTPLAALSHIRVDFVNEEPSPTVLSKFDTMVFAAGNDIRHVPPGDDYYDHVWHANAVAQPRFFAAAKGAGIALAINIGSYYPHVMPEALDSNLYMRSRKAAHDSIATLADGHFKFVSLDAPFVAGAVPGLDSMFSAYVAYAEGRIPELDVFAPPGGVNFITTNSISDAVETVLAGAGESGRAYLLGDQNLRFQEFFGEFFNAVGKRPPPVLDREHPLLPDSAMPWGRGGELFFDTDPAETELLAYRRGDVLRCIREEIVPQYITCP